MSYYKKDTGSLNNGGTISGDLDVSGNASVGGTFGVTGLTTLSTTQVQAPLVVSGYFQNNTLRYASAANYSANSDQNQTNATSLGRQYNIVTTVDSPGDAVKLTAAFSGLIQVVHNAGANDLAIYPSSGDAIDDLGLNAPYYLHPGSAQQFLGLSDSLWTRLNRGLRYVARAEPSAADLVQSSMTMDGGWYDWDISSIVPLSARGKPIHFHKFIVNSTATIRFMGLRTNGDTASNFKQFAKGSNNVGDYLHVTMPCDSSGIVEYRVSGATTTAELTVLGWWVEG